MVEKRLFDPWGALKKVKDGAGNTLAKIQVLMGGMQGSGFWAGLAAGAISSIASSAYGEGYNHEGIGADGKMINPTKVWNGAGSFSGGAVGQLAFGAVMGGAGAKLAGGNFWQGAVTGLVVSGLNHALHDGDQEDPKPKKYKGSLKSSHGEKVYTLEEWYAKYGDKSYNEIITEADSKQGLPGGPTWRYVRNPIDGNIMDMRHVSVVGYGMGNTAGDMVEHIQYGTGDRSNSAYDIQDYYSNKIGAYFYQLRHSGSWASNSWAYDFKRFILTQYRTLQPAIMANIPKQ